MGIGWEWTWDFSGKMGIGLGFLWVPLGRVLTTCSELERRMFRPALAYVRIGICHRKIGSRRHRALALAAGELGRGFIISGRRSMRTQPPIVLATRAGQRRAEAEQAGASPLDGCGDVGATPP